jgi:hypothetical protein
MLLIVVSAIAQTPVASNAVTTDGLPCTSFTWSADKESPYAGMIVPISLDGVTYKFQLDTGADTLITYGKTPHTNWKTQGKTVRIENVRFAGMSFAATLGYPQPSMPDNDVQGTLGLELLVGNVFIIDFPKQRVCLFNHADAPDRLMDAARWIPGEIRHGHFSIDTELDGIKLKDMIYDTGSSSRGLDVDFEVWKLLTGRTEAIGTTPPIEEHIWGKPMHLIRAPAKGNLTVGKSVLSGLMVSTTLERPHYYRDDMTAGGVIGNAPFLHDIVILDLGSFPAFGLIEAGTSGMK